MHDNQHTPKNEPADIVEAPPGNAKSTSLYVALRDLASPDAPIYAIEDPIEVPMTFEMGNVAELQATIEQTATTLIEAPRPIDGETLP